MNWKVFSASAIGKDHIGIGLPCQDDSAFRIVGDVLIGVVCDGAGSAAHSEVGAKACTQSVAESIAKFLGDSPSENLDKACSRDKLEAAIETVRVLLQSLADAQGYQFRDLSCTLVGCIASPLGGSLFHIGDGFGVAEFDSSPPVVSLPENGEYANETYFVTATDWKDRLRIKPLVAFQSARIALMSDGAAPFVINREQSGFSEPFIKPVAAYLSDKAQDEGNLALLDTLADERTYAITGDDKTLLLGLWQ